MNITLDGLLQILIDQKGSDLYCVAGSQPIIRVYGIGRPAIDTVLTEANTLALAQGVLSPEQWKTFENDPEINLAYCTSNGARFRGNIYRQKGSVAMVFRLVETNIPTIEQLKLPAILERLVLEPWGLILVTGSTGSGKSSSLAAMIHHRNLNLAGHIVTIEDPIEFLHKNELSIISQREVGTDTQSFAKALRSVLRQAPDVILIGEMRDQVTVTSAIDFSETGHLVLSTLHSTNAHQTIERILQFYTQEEYPRVLSSLANNLTAIISQRLVKRADGKGRIPAVEIMINTPRISDILRKGDLNQLKTAIAAGAGENMQTFDQHLYQLYTQKLITMEEALAAADSQNDLKLRIRGMTTYS